MFTIFSRSSNHDQFGVSSMLNDNNASAMFPQSQSPTPGQGWPLTYNNNHLQQQQHQQQLQVQRAQESHSTKRLSGSWQAHTQERQRSMQQTLYYHVQQGQDQVQTQMPYQIQNSSQVEARHETPDAFSDISGYNYYAPPSDNTSTAQTNTTAANYFSNNATHNYSSVDRRSGIFGNGYAETRATSPADVLHDPGSPEGTSPGAIKVGATGRLPSYEAQVQQRDNLFIGEHLNTNTTADGLNLRRGLSGGDSGFPVDHPRHGSSMLAQTMPVGTHPVLQTTNNPIVYSRGQVLATRQVLATIDESMLGGGDAGFGTGAMMPAYQLDSAMRGGFGDPENGHGLSSLAEEDIPRYNHMQRSFTFETTGDDDEDKNIGASVPVAKADNTDTTADNSTHAEIIDREATKGVESAYPEPPERLVPFLNKLSNDAGIKEEQQQELARRLTCDECDPPQLGVVYKTQGDLKAHVKKEHRRYFVCRFNFAGCNETFSTKNEWKRHIMSQHITPGYYFCAHEGCQYPKHFVRKDLFVQHLWRMHTPEDLRKEKEKLEKEMAKTAKTVKELVGDIGTAVSKSRKNKSIAAKKGTSRANHNNADDDDPGPSSAGGDASGALMVGTPELQDITRQHDIMAQDSFIVRLVLPTLMVCPVPGCDVRNEGEDAWDKNMEHLASHMMSQFLPPVFGNEIDRHYLLPWLVANGVLAVNGNDGWRAVKFVAPVAEIRRDRAQRAEQPAPAINGNENSEQVGDAGSASDDDETTGLEDAIGDTDMTF
ncbi:hypothetical protein SEUCBS139899_000260 [Sporothrix eucalyptigena]